MNATPVGKNSNCFDSPVKFAIEFEKDVQKKFRDSFKSSKGLEWTKKLKITNVKKVWNLIDSYLKLTVEFEKSVRTILEIPSRVPRV